MDLQIPYLAPAIQVVVSLWRVDLGQQEPSLRAAVFCVNVSGHGEPRLQDLLGIIQGSLQQLFKVLILCHFLVARLSPLGDGLECTEEDKDDINDCCSCAVMWTPGEESSPLRGRWPAGRKCPLTGFYQAGYCHCPGEQAVRNRHKQIQTNVANKYSNNGMKGVILTSGGP